MWRTIPLMLAFAAALSASSSALAVEVDFEGPGYEPGVRPPTPPWYDDWDKDWDENDFTVEAEVGFDGSQGLVVRSDRGVYYELETPLNGGMGARTVSAYFRPEAPPQGWYFADMGGIQVGRGTKAGGTALFAGCIFRVVNGNPVIYGPGSMWGTPIGPWSPGQWYEITFDIAPDWESITISVGLVGESKVSEVFDWNVSEVTRIWTVESSTNFAVYDNLSISAPPGPDDAFAAWIDGFDLSDELAKPEAAPAGDGVPNLIKYTLGIEPLDIAVHALPSAELVGFAESFHLSITAVVRDDDPQLTVAAEASVDLVAWDLPVTELDEPGQDGVADGFQRRSWRTDLPADEEAKTLFLRLKAER